MKLQVVCHECIKNVPNDDLEKMGSFFSNYVYNGFPEIELDNTIPYYSYKCDKGHSTTFYLQNELYELLFQQATYCIIDGYYREAITTYNASLERFFEYAIEIIMHSNNPDVNFKNIWKQVSNQSERQLGAFYFLWTSFFKEEPPYLKRSMVTLRNDVVHKGALVSKEKSIKFGEYVFDYIRLLLDKVNSLNEEKDFLPAMQRQIRLVEASRIKFDNIDSHSTMVTPTFITSFDSIMTYDDIFLEKNQLPYGIIK